MRVAVPLLTALVLAGTSACTAFSEGDGFGDGDVRVATGFYPLQFVTERVGGDLVNLRGQPGIIVCRADHLAMSVERTLTSDVGGRPASTIVASS